MNDADKAEHVYFEGVGLAHVAHDDRGAYPDADRPTLALLVAAYDGRARFRAAGEVGVVPYYRRIEDAGPARPAVARRRYSASRQNSPSVSRTRWT